MLGLYEKYGFYQDSVASIEMSGVDGVQKIRELMEKLRASMPTELAGIPVVRTRDYKKDEIRDLETGEISPTGLPNSDVLYFDLKDGSWVCVRPSGTEPKIKFYYGVKGNSLADAAERGEKMAQALKKLAG